MGYYENPPIIQPSRGGEIIGASIAQAGQSIAQGLIARGERRRAEEKEQKLTLQKLQDRKNETDLYYNEKLSKWGVEQKRNNQQLDGKIRDLVQQKIILAADSRIALLNETDAKKRQEYLTNIRIADKFLDTTASFATLIGGSTATWRKETNASKVGIPGGHAVNGSTDKEILDNTAAIEILGGMDDLYDNTNIDVNPDSNGDGIMLTITGKHKKTGELFDIKVDSKTYESADEAGVGNLLIPIESMDTFFTQARETVSNKDGVFKGFLEDTHETYDLDSSGGDIYQIKDGRRLQEKVIRDQINKKSSVTASGIMSADKPDRLRALLNYSLGQGPQYYDKVFKVDEKGNVRSVDDQKQMLTQLLTDKSFEGIVKDFERTTDKKGNVTYWNPSSDVKIKDKPEKTGGGTNGGNNNTEETDTGGGDYRGEYYDALIKGPKRVKGESEAIYAYRSRKDYAKNLNRLAGSTDKFITTDDLYKKFLQEPIKKGATLSFADQIESGKLTKEQVKKSFNSRFPKSDMYYEKSPGDYRALSNYNLNKATSRAKLALDFTAGEGEVKKLQGKVGEASVADWVKANRKGTNETDLEYVARYKKTLK
jgi:hypothetical protein